MATRALMLKHVIVMPKKNVLVHSLFYFLLFGWKIYNRRRPLERGVFIRGQNMCSLHAPAGFGRQL